MASCPVPAWSTSLERKGLYFEGIVDAAVLDEVLELHKRDTVSTFGTRSSRRVARPKKGTRASNVTTEPHQTEESKEDSEENVTTTNPPQNSKSTYSFKVIASRLYL